MERSTIRGTRLVVLASGNGSNLQAILDACNGGPLPADVVGVVSDRAGAFALERARTAGVPAVHVRARSNEERRAYDARLADAVSGFSPDIVVLAGWMRILSTTFLGGFADRVVNLHPALPGELPGTNAIARAWQQALDGERQHSGVMIHRVPDEGVDDGPVLATATVAIDVAAGFEAFESAMHTTERLLLVDTLAGLCAPSDLGTPSGLGTPSVEVPA